NTCNGYLDSAAPPVAGVGGRQDASTEMSLISELQETEKPELPHRGIERGEGPAPHCAPGPKTSACANSRNSGEGCRRDCPGSGPVPQRRVSPRCPWRRQESRRCSIHR